MEAVTGKSLFFFFMSVLSSVLPHRLTRGLTYCLALGSLLSFLPASLVILFPSFLIRLCPSFTSSFLTSSFVLLFFSSYSLSFFPMSPFRYYPCSSSSLFSYYFKFSLIFFLLFLFVPFLPCRGPYSPCSLLIMSLFYPFC